MSKIKTEFDRYTDKKLLINLVDDFFRITDIEFDCIYDLDYVILTINEDYYITYSKVILKQLKSYDFINKLVVLKKFSINDFINRKYHKLYIVGYL